MIDQRLIIDQRFSNKNEEFSKKSFENFSTQKPIFENFQKTKMNAIYFECDSIEFIIDRMLLTFDLTLIDDETLIDWTLMIYQVMY
jgi:hypothetical protein